MKFEATIYNYKDVNTTLDTTVDAYCFEEAVSKVYLWRLQQGMNWRVKTVRTILDNQQQGKVKQQ